MKKRLIPTLLFLLAFITPAMAQTEEAVAEREVELALVIRPAVGLARKHLRQYAPRKILAQPNDTGDSAHICDMLSTIWR